MYAFLRCTHLNGEGWRIYIFIQVICSGIYTNLLKAVRIYKDLVLTMEKTYRD